MRAPDRARRIRRHNDLDQAAARLREEYIANGKQDLFEALSGFLTEESRFGDYAEVAKRLGMSASTVAVTVHRLRQRYRQMVREIVLPNHCCVKCDQPADAKPLRKKFSWHHPALALLILVAILIYVIVALIVRKSATVTMPLCQRHRARRARAIWTSWGMFFGGIGAIVAAINFENGWVALFGALTLLTSIIVAVAGTQIITPKKIDEQYAWFRGASPAYLSGLPAIYHQ